jgi:hypothetical protein
MEKANGIVCSFRVKEGFNEYGNRFYETSTLTVQKRMSNFDCDNSDSILNAIASMPFMPKEFEHGSYYQAIWCDKKGLSFKEIQ